jgi:parallel beta-helix repeat protein
LVERYGLETYEINGFIRGSDLNKDWRLILVLLMGSLFCIALLGLHQPTSPIEKYQYAKSDSSLRGRDAIYISNNASLAAYASGGNGSLQNPYIIAGLIVNGSGSNNGIEIQGTTAHFILQNCTVRNWEYSIYLRNVVNGQLLNNTIEVNKYGLWMENSHNIAVSNNTVRGSTSMGITLDKSFNCSISINRIYNNARGIRVNNSYGNTISENDINRHTGGWGIGLGFSTFNQIIHNFVNKSQSGIILSYSSYNLIASNNISNTYGGDSDAGVYLFRSPHNEISKNLGWINSYAFIGLLSSLNTTIFGNSIYNQLSKIAYFGINSLNSSKAIISHNSINGTRSGIRFYKGHNNTLTDNILINNTIYGIEIVPSGLFPLDKFSYSLIQNNTIKFSCSGIYSGEDGFYNTIMNNTLEWNENGVHLYNTSYNNITGNRINNNMRYGVLLEGACNNFLTGNIIHGNLIGIKEVTCRGNILAPNDRRDRAPGAPVLYSCSNLGDGRISLAWYGEDGATTYYIYRNNTPVGQAPASGFYCHAIDQLPIRGFYYYAIVAGNPWSNSTLSNNFTVDTRSPDNGSIAGFHLEIVLLGVLSLLLVFQWKWRKK